METKAYCLNCFSEMGGSEIKCVHCGWTDEGQMKNALPYGTLLNEKYLIGQAVRQNGSGFTYAALEKKSNRKVEIREFFPDLIARRESNGCIVLPANGAELKYNDYLSEFEQLSQKLFRVSGMKRIQAVIDIFSQNNTMYMVFSYVTSQSLQSYVEKNGLFTWEDCEKQFLPVIQALSTLHGQDVNHLGISPETLRFTEDNVMILTDFEIQSVRRAGTDLSEDVYPGCWALEQYSKSRICDEVTDVYGLCASLLFALTGAVPAEAVKRKSDPKLMISRSILKTLPEQVIPAIANALQVEPDDRTSSFSRLSAELTAEPMLMERMVEAQTLRSLPTMDRRDPKVKNLPPFVWLLVSFVVSLSVIIIVGAVWFKDSPFSPQSLLSVFDDPQVQPTSQTIKVPNLVGEDIEKIRELTETSSEYAFTIRIYEENFDDEIPAGQILDQLPFAGSLIKAGDTVKVAVSRGKAVHVLPDIVDMPEETALKMLETQGYVPVSIPTFSEEYAVGCVVGYVEALPGDDVAHGAVVQIYVSAEQEAEPVETE